MSKLTPEKIARFIALVDSGTAIGVAAKAIDVTRQSLYALRDKNKEFAAAWAEAWDHITDVLEDSVYKRAMSTSDLLAIFMLKARRPETYRENVNHNHTGNVTIQRVNFGALEAPVLKIIEGKVESDDDG